MIVGFAEKFTRRIKTGLPGFETQKKMFPEARITKSFEESEYPDAKKASVLILFYPFADAIYTVFIKRPDYEGVHSGQISFPGGKAEPADSTLEFTAVREAEEEIGIKREEIKIIGSLSHVYIPPSNFFVTPIAAYCLQRPVFKADKNEVAQIVEVPVKIFTDPSVKGVMEITRNEAKFNAPYYLAGTYKIWGATAIILSELEEILKDIL